MIVKIPDVSHHNNISNLENFTNATLKYGGVILKATEGVGYIDPKYEERSNHFCVNGVTMDTYHFARPSYVNHPVEDASDEARFYLSSLRHGKPGWLDWEATHDNQMPIDKLKKSWVDEWIATWMKQVKGLGVYCSFELAKTLGGDYPLWIAKWSRTPPPKMIGDHPVKLWQYTSKGKYPGISSIDLSRLVTDD